MSCHKDGQGRAEPSWLREP
ncbi:hypothetical protein [uncultured Muribaculum sp.]